MSDFEPIIRRYLAAQIKGARCRERELVLEGDRLVAMQNARALHRMMNIMRETGAPNV